MIYERVLLVARLVGVATRRLARRLGVFAAFLAGLVLAGFAGLVLAGFAGLVLAGGRSTRCSRAAAAERRRSAVFRIALDCLPFAPADVALTLRATFFRKPVARRVANSSLSSFFGI
jgi:hypothetical protein